MQYLLHVREDYTLWSRDCLMADGNAPQVGLLLWMMKVFFVHAHLAAYVRLLLEQVYSSDCLIAAQPSVNALCYSASNLLTVLRM
jgi:hypothetical protein